MTAHSHVRLQFRCLGNRSALTLKPYQKETYLFRSRSFIAKHGVLLVIYTVISWRQFRITASPLGGRSVLRRHHFAGVFRHRTVGGDAQHSPPRDARPGGAAAGEEDRVRRHGEDAVHQPGHTVTLHGPAPHQGSVWNYRHACIRNYTRKSPLGFS